MSDHVTPPDGTCYIFGENSNRGWLKLQEVIWNSVAFVFHTPLTFWRLMRFNQQLRLFCQHVAASAEVACSSSCAANMSQPSSSAVTWAAGKHQNNPVKTASLCVLQPIRRAEECPPNRRQLWSNAPCFGNAIVVTVLLFLSWFGSRWLFPPTRNQSWGCSDSKACHFWSAVEGGFRHKVWPFIKSVMWGIVSVSTKLFQVRHDVSARWSVLEPGEVLRKGHIHGSVTLGCVETWGTWCTCCWHGCSRYGAAMTQSQKHGFRSNRIKTEGTG